MNSLKSGRSGTFDWKTLLSAPVLLAGLLAVYLLYQPGLNSPVLNDTRFDLVGLSATLEIGQARIFIFSGDVGPLGRLIALLGASMMDALATYDQDIAQSAGKTSCREIHVGEDVNP